MVPRTDPMTHNTYTQNVFHFFFFGVVGGWVGSDLFLCWSFFCLSYKVWWTNTNPQRRDTFSIVSYRNHVVLFFFYIENLYSCWQVLYTHTHTHTHTHTLSLSHTYNSDRKTMRDCYSARLQESERSKKKNTEFWVIHTLPIDKGWDSLIVVLFIYNPVTSPC